MKGLIIRTGSGSIQAKIHLTPISSPRFSSAAACNRDLKRDSRPQRISLHLEVPGRSIRRSSSECNVIRSEVRTLSSFGWRSFPARIPEEVEGAYAADWPASGIPVEELGFPGGGINRRGNSGRGGNEENADRRGDMGFYYREMLKSNPMDPLLLRNYAEYLHEVERDEVKAEEYYGRAILSNPGDGELLALYGKFIWESQKDEYRAKLYLDQAIQASPNDCTILGSYAHFMWEADDEEEEEVMEKKNEPLISLSPLGHGTVEAF